MTRTIPFKISALVCSILVLAIALNGLLSLLSFEKKLKSFVAAKIANVGGSVKNSVTYGLHLGLDLPAMQNLQQVVEDFQQKNRELHDIAIVDRSGKALYHSTRRKVGEMLELAATLQGKGAKKDAFTVESPEQYSMVFPLANNFDLVVGFLVLEYPKSAVQTVIIAASGQLLRFGILLCGIFFLLAIVVNHLFLRRFNATAEWFLQALSQLSTRGEVLMLTEETTVSFRNEFSEYQRHSLEKFHTSSTDTSPCCGQQTSGNG